MSFPDAPEVVDFYRSQLLMHFRHNQSNQHNRDAIFFYSFSDDDVFRHKSNIHDALKQLGRPFCEISCEGKTYRQVIRDIALALGRDVPEAADRRACWEAMEEAALGGSKTIVIDMLSRGRGTWRPGMARSLIKMLDDARLRGYYPTSDILFIDRASFLEASWPEIGIYLRLVPPFDSWRAWMDTLSSATGSTLRGV